MNVIAVGRSVKKNEDVLEAESQSANAVIWFSKNSSGKNIGCV